MSLAGMIMRAGSVATIYHGLDTVAADKSSVRTYPTNTPAVGILVEDLSDELARRVFGAETKARCRGIVTDSTVVMNDGDGVTITSGPHAGDRFRIETKLLQQSGVSPHRELALVA